LQKEGPETGAEIVHSGVGTVLIVEDHELVRAHARDQVRKPWL
jgi:hypothetical protein